MGFAGGIDHFWRLRPAEHGGGAHTNPAHGPALGAAQLREPIRSLDAASCERIQQNVFPVAVAGGEALRRDPSRLPEAVSAHMRARAMAGQQQRETVQRKAAIVALPVTEKPITVYGTPMWPWTPTSTVAWTYQEALEAAWFFRAIHGYLLGTPHERAVIINLMLRWLTPAHRTGWSAALRFVAQAYELNPEGENRYMPPPINFGE